MTVTTSYATNHTSEAAMAFIELPKKKIVQGEYDVRSRKPQTTTYRWAEDRFGAKIWKPTEPSNAAETGEPERAAQESAVGTRETRSREEAGLSVRAARLTSSRHPEKRRMCFTFKAASAILQAA
jgi:hypothetical protein